VHVRIEQRVAAPVAGVEGALLDAGFWDEVAKVATVAQPVLLDQEADGDRVRQRVRFRFVAALSPAARAVLDPAKLTFVQDADVDRSGHRADFQILPDHYADRLDAAGSWVLDADGGSTLRVYDADLHVHFPFIGGQVEKALASGLRTYAEQEAAALGRWLAAD
jgi:hypothetical protein